MEESINLKSLHPISNRIVIKKTIGWFIFALIFLVISLLITSKSTINFETIKESLSVINFIGFFVFFIKASYAYLYHLTIQYRIEDSSFMMSKGVLINQQAIIPFSQITDVFIKRGFLDFLLGLSTIEISSASDYDTEFAIIEGFTTKEADGMRRTIRKALNDYHSHD